MKEGDFWWMPISEDEIAVHPRVYKRHPELAEGDVKAAWYNAIAVECRMSDDGLKLVAVGFDSKRRFVEMVAAVGSERFLHLPCYDSPIEENTSRAGSRKEVAVDAREFEEALGVTADDLDRWAAPYERGEWPEGETLYVAYSWDELYALAEKHGDKLPPRDPVLPTIA